ncbi:MAG: glycerol-3-phosphate dehydrogenase/oxidase [Methylococcales bacterium]
MQREFSSLKDRKFDLLICGGGIYGAWTAYDAALRGLQVAIVDQGDWASGTSSASSKLIHGGLRYLETLDFKLVKKALAERELLLAIAPHRVWPLRFGVPVYKDSRIGRLQLKLGLMLYDFLGRNQHLSQRHRYFNRQQFTQQFPSLNHSNLSAGFTYVDAQTDDARLVLELIDGALSAGAVCLSYCEISRYLENNAQVCGAEVIDLVSRESLEVYAKQIVNTTGRWMTELEEVNPWCRLSKGVHLVLPNILNDRALLLTAKSDGRVFFIIPWYGLTLIGTTDTNYAGNLDQPNVEQDEINYLLNEANHCLHDVNWKQDDILGKFAGLRVLQQSGKSSPSTISRDWELKTLQNGLHISLGGKITSAREDAANIVDTVMKRLGIDQNCQTQDRSFPWKPPKSYSQWHKTNMDKAVNLGIDSESAHWLLRRHGNRVAQIFRLIENQPDLVQRITTTTPFILADLVFCAEQEMVVHLEDLLRRRIPLFILTNMSFSKLRELAEITGNVLGWDETRTNTEIDLCTRTWLCL